MALPGMVTHIRSIRRIGEVGLSILVNRSVWATERDPVSIKQKIMPGGSTAHL